jgi:hypothetical protein
MEMRAFGRSDGRLTLQAARYVSETPFALGMLKMNVSRLLTPSVARTRDGQRGVEGKDKDRGCVRGRRRRA